MTPEEYCDLAKSLSDKLIQLNNVDIKTHIKPFHCYFVSGPAYFKTVIDYHSIILFDGLLYIPFSYKNYKVEVRRV